VKLVRFKWQVPPEEALKRIPQRHGLATRPSTGPYYGSRGGAASPSAVLPHQTPLMAHHKDMSTERVLKATSVHDLPDYRSQQQQRRQVTERDDVDAILQHIYLHTGTSALLVHGYQPGNGRYVIARKDIGDRIAPLVNGKHKAKISEWGKTQTEEQWKALYRDVGHKHARWQDFKEFLLQPWGMVGWDTTFKLMTRFVTPILYEAVDLLNDVGLHPWLPVAYIIHDTLSADDKAFGLNTLVELCPGLSEMKVLVHDDGADLLKGKKMARIDAVSLLDFQHTGILLEHTGVQHGLTDAQAKQCRADVYGDPFGSTSLTETPLPVSNIADAAQALAGQWRQRYGTPGVQLGDYLSKNCVQDIANYQCLTVRQYAGLGEHPRKPWSQSLEAHNRDLKILRKDTAGTDASMRDTLGRVVENGDLESKVARIGKGRWALSPPYANERRSVAAFLANQTEEGRANFLQSCFQEDISVVDPVAEAPADFDMNVQTFSRKCNIAVADALTLFNKAKELKVEITNAGVAVVSTKNTSPSIVNGLPVEGAVYSRDELAKVACAGPCR
jgi:hypothetical protein